MTTSGFYKVTDSDELIYAPNFVYGAGVELIRGAKDSYSYPVDGWYWFDTKEAAEAFFGQEFNPPGQLPPPQTFEDWDTFNAQILSDITFNQYVGACLQIAPVLALSLPAALAQVADKGVASFQLVYTSFCAIANVNQSDRIRWKQFAINANLRIEFVNIIA